MSHSLGIAIESLVAILLMVTIGYCMLLNMRLKRLKRYRGSATTWENNTMPGTTAFVVELPAGPVSAAAAQRYAHAVLAVARTAP